MEKIKQSWFVFLCAVILLGLTQLPYFLAFSSSSSGYVFGGFLINPLDGNSYLAKMYEGYRGDWTFTLPFTAQQGKGTFLYFFYILLGHLARILNIPLIMTYHLARGICCLILVWALSDFLELFFKDKWAYRFALLFACFGAGMGWVLMPSGYVASDFWVAEAYPFLSSLVNPHFCLGISLMLWLIKVLIIDYQPTMDLSKYIYVSAASLILALLAPFAYVMVIVLLVISVAENIIGRLKEKQSLFTGKLLTNDWAIFCSLLGGIPVIAYELYVMNSDPLLKGWQAQNITPSPPIWDFILSFSPLLILAIPAVVIVLRNKMNSWYPIIIWLIIGPICIYFPWSLQRRFFFGYFIPVVMLAVLTLQYVRSKAIEKRLVFNSILAVVIICCIMTNMVLELTTVYGIQAKDPLLFLTTSESMALSWINEYTPPDAIILASPQMGMFIPAQTGRRVIYGHPFETVNAENRKSEVTAFFEEFGSESAQPELEAYLKSNGVEYIFWGRRERLLCKNQEDVLFIDDLLNPVFKDNEVIVFQVVQ